VKLIAIKTGALFLIAASFVCIFSLLQNERIFNKSLGRITFTYENVDGTISSVKKTYQKVTNENLNHWDAGHYDRIRREMYRVEPYASEARYAFFPLFPLLWKYSGFNHIGIVILNFVLFYLGLHVLSGIIFTKGVSEFENTLISISAILFPSSFSFYIPYTEALFLFTMATAVWGLYKDKYWIYFIGMTAFAMTKPVITIVLFSFICTDVFFLFKHRNIRIFLQSFISKIFPIVIGTGVALFIQYLYSGSFTKFFEVQKAWNHNFRIPKEIYDWSVEGYGASVFAIFFILFPALSFLIFKTLKLVKTKDADSEYEIKDYFFIQPLFYFIGIGLFIFFFQGGSLNGLQRYIMATPFFYITLFYLPEKIKDIKKFYLFSAFILLTFLSALFMQKMNYAPEWSFSDLGYFISLLVLGFILFKNYLNHAFQIACLCIIALIAILWQTYLFNSFLSGGWIIT